MQRLGTIVFEVLIGSRIFKVCRTRASAQLEVAKLITNPNGPFGVPWIRETKYY